MSRPHHAPVRTGLVLCTALLAILGAWPSGAQPAVPLTEDAKLVASDGANWNWFGYSVAASGDTIVVGAHKHNVGANREQGAAYVFVRTGGSWTQQAKLVAAGGAAHDDFGVSVAIDGDTVVVGAEGADIDGRSAQGAAFVFVRTGTTWTQQARLVAADGATGDLLGRSVAVSGDTVLAGAPFADVDHLQDHGAAYAFVRTGHTWTQQHKLRPSDGQVVSLFGSRVALSGDTALVAAPGHDVGGVLNNGAAYVFTRAGSAWQQQAQLSASDGTAEARLGHAAAISGNTVVLSSIAAAGGRGAAYVFERSGSAWTERATLVGHDTVNGDRFGYDVAVRDDRIAVGATNVANWAGAVYAFVRDARGWREEAKLMASDGASGDDLGCSVSLGDGYVLGGAYGDVIGGQTFVGSAYVFSHCAFTLSHAEATVPAAGGTLSVGVSTAEACAWTASSETPWVSVADGPAAGAGPLTYTVAANTGPARAATLTIAGRAFAVTQASGCAHTLSFYGTRIGVAGGPGAVQMTASDPACPWTAQSNVPWIVVTSRRTGTGDATVAYAVPPNTGPPRTGTLTLAGQTLTIDQPAGAPGHVVYLAEGATGPFFDTRIALLNTEATPASATVRYLRTVGPPVDQAVTVPPLTRVTVDPELLLGAAEFSTVVDSTGPLVVDRTMRWDDRGYGAHAERGIPAPAIRWYLAEGATHSGFDLFYLIQNPGPDTARVEIRYLRPAPQAAITRIYEVAGNSRFNVWVDTEGPELDNTDVSAVVTSLNFVPIIVERAMYLDAPGHLFNAGHESAGILAPATSWFLAEGATGDLFDLFVLVANPTAEDARIEARYLLPDGTSLTKTYDVAANTRFNIWVDQEEIPAGSGVRPLADTAVSVTLTSTNGVPVIVERAMWWPWGPATWHEAHNSAGTTSTSTLWAMAEGEVGGPSRLDTYVLIANTSSWAGQARVTLLFEDGSSQHRVFDLAPSSRTNVNPAADFGVRDRRFGVIVESLGEPPPQIVVERAMYSDAEGVWWAAGTNAGAMPLR